jgi:hypothetical protein
VRGGFPRIPFSSLSRSTASGRKRKPGSGSQTRKEGMKAVFPADSPHFPRAFPNPFPHTDTPMMSCNPAPVLYQSKLGHSGRGFMRGLLKLHGGMFGEWFTSTPDVWFLSPFTKPGPDLSLVFT